MMGMYTTADLAAYNPKFAPREAAVVKQSLTAPLPTMQTPIVLPLPPINNHLYLDRIIKKPGKPPYVLRVLTPEAREFKARAASIIRASGLKIMDGEIVCYVWIYRPRKIGDICGRNKALMDAVTDGGGWTDDGQIVRYVEDRLDDKHNPRAEIFFERARADAPLFEVGR